jgi:hypothetical protein
MQSMFSLFKKAESETALIFDIGNGSIGAAIVSFPKGGTPLILYTHREPLTFLSEVSTERLLDSMLKLLKAVAFSVQKEGIAHIHKNFFSSFSIKHTYCIFSSPWYVSHTKVIKVTKDKPFVLSKESIDAIMAKEEKEFNAALTNGDYKQKFGTDIRLLERKIIHTRLNGYEVSDPIGKKAVEFEITFFISFVSEEVIRGVEQVLQSTVRSRNIVFYSYALSSWDAVRSMFPDNPHFLFADITNEVTDISITARGVLMETISFPAGRSMFIRDACEKLAVPPEVALSYLRMYTSGSLAADVTPKIEQIIKESADIWHAALILALTELGKRYPLPKSMFLTVDTDLAAIFIAQLKKEMPLELNVPHNMFDVTFLNAAKIQHYTDFAPHITQDSFLGIESIFVNNII